MNVKTDDLGRLTADAVIAQHEETAKAIEAMGEEVKKRLNKLEGAMHQCEEDLKQLKELAEAIRDKGKTVSLQIEEANHLSEEIRAEAKRFNDRLNPPKKAAPATPINQTIPVKPSDLLRPRPEQSSEERELIISNRDHRL